MSLFAKKGEKSRDYKALLASKSETDTLLLLTPAMRQDDVDIEDVDILELTTDAKALYTQAELEAELEGAKDQLQADLTSSHAEILAALKTDIEAVKTSRRKTAKNLRAKNRILETRDQELIARQAELDASLETNKALMDELFERAEKMDRQRARIKALKNTLAETRAQLGSTEFQLSAFRDEMAVKHMAETAERETRIQAKAIIAEETQIREQQTRDAQAALEASLQTLKQQLAQSRTELDETRRQHAALKNDYETIRSEKQVLENREDVVKDTLEAARNKLLQMRKRAEDTRAETILVEAKNRALTRRQEELEAELSQLSAKSLNRVA